MKSMMNSIKNILLLLGLYSFLCTNAQLTQLSLSVPMPIKQTQATLQFNMNNISMGNYYNINIDSISLSLKGLSDPLYLLVLVTEFQLDTRISPQDVMNRYKNKYSMDYDGFGMKANNQIIKYYQSGQNPIFITVYLYDNSSGNLNAISSTEYASYTITVTKQTQSNYCAYNCVKGSCGSTYQCSCPVSVGNFYFDEICKYQAIQVKLNDNIIQTVQNKCQYYYLEITDTTTSYSLVVSSSSVGNYMTYIVYDSTQSSYSVPNFLNDYVNFKSSNSRTLQFTKDWVYQQSIASGNSSIKVIFGLYDESGLQSTFNIQYFQNLVLASSDSMPSWAVYLFACLAVLGLIFMIFVIFQLVRGTFTSNARQIRVGPFFVTIEVIEKYMPKMLYKEINIKKEDQEECTICLEGYQDSDSVRISICGHLYHQQCIDKWLISHTSCPYCRQELTEKELESWLQKKIQEQYMKQQQKELKDMMVQFLDNLKNNENIKNILKDCHQESKQKRSFLSISNNNANLKNNFSESSSISSIKQQQDSYLPAIKSSKQQPKSRKQKNLTKKSHKLHSQSFQIGYDLDVNINDLMNDNNIYSLSSNRKGGVSQQIQKENQFIEDDYNLPSNFLQSQSSQDQFNLLLQNKQSSNKRFARNPSANNQSESQSSQLAQKLGMDSIAEDFGDTLRGSQLQSQINSQINLQRKKNTTKRTQMTQSSSKNNLDFPTTAQNFEQDQGLFTDKQEFEYITEWQQLENNNENQIKKERVPQHDLRQQDANISFGGKYINQNIDDYQRNTEMDKMKAKSGTESDKQFGTVQLLDENSSSINNFQQNHTHQSLKQQDPLQNINQQVNQPCEINDMEFEYLPSQAIY